MYQPSSHAYCLTDSVKEVISLTVAGLSAVLYLHSRHNLMSDSLGAWLSVGAWLSALSSL